MRALLLSLLILGCEAAPAREVGAPDASRRGGGLDVGPDGGGDGGAWDAEPPDGGAWDAGLPDGGAWDAGPPDAGSGDAGVPCAVRGVPGVCLPTRECTGDRMPTPGFCPGPADIQCCTPRSGGCDPADAPTPNEGLREAPGRGGCPRGMARVDRFCIDVYEASLVLVDASGPIGSWSPFQNPGTNRVMAVSIEGAVPQGYINATQAAAACAEAGKRLCTDAEWLRACRGPSGWTYPYGPTRVDGVCNDARAVHPAYERFGTMEDWVFSRLGDACINQLPDSLDPTGSNPGCVTGEGIFDLMGNLHEWTSDPAGTFRGGYYVDTVRNGPGCLYRTTAHDVSHWDYSTGFRCCAD